MDEQVSGLTIQVVAEHTGISVHTLRTWERRYGIPKPQRNARNRYRLYDEQDIADVLWLKRQVDSGISPAQASAVLHYDRRQKGPVTPEIPTAQPITATREALVEALARSNQATARQLLDQAFALFTPEQVVPAILEPAMMSIGERWMRNEMTVWQEHLASNLIQNKVASVLQSQPALPMTAPAVIAACAPTEEHALGLLTFSLLARRQGWRVLFLGQRTPLADLREIGKTKPEAIGVSVTTVTGLAGLIPWLDPANRPTCRLVFGGRMPALLPALREHLPGEYLGDDAVTSARALALTRSRLESWAPSASAWKAANALSVQRLKCAADVVAQFMNTLPTHSRHTWASADLNQATLFLIDALLCALAFGAPESIDAERDWLAEVMPPRHVSGELLHRHYEQVESVLRRVLPKEQYRHYSPLLDRLMNPTVG